VGRKQVVSADRSLVPLLLSSAIACTLMTAGLPAGSPQRVKSTSSNYVISCSSNNISRHNSSYIGKLYSNFIGTEFRIFDVNNIGTKPATALSPAGTSTKAAATDSVSLAAMASAQEPRGRGNCGGLGELEMGAVQLPDKCAGDTRP